MPAGLQAALSLEEFTDLIAYLENLKQPEMQLANAAGTPAAIQLLSRPVVLQPFHSTAHRFDHPVWFEEHPVLDGTFVVAEQTNAAVYVAVGETGSRRRQEPLSQTCARRCS